jgi:hypothetical protein
MEKTKFCCQYGETAVTDHLNTGYKRLSVTNAQYVARVKMKLQVSENMATLACYN